MPKLEQICDRQPTALAALVGFAKMRFINISLPRAGGRGEGVPMLLDHQSDHGSVQIGAKYRRPGGLEGPPQVAEVQGVVEDRNGIPHVRFLLSYERANHTFEDGPRTLSLAAFMRCYKDPL